MGAVGDLCRALEVNVSGYCDIIVQKLLEALQAPNLDRAVKPEILAVLGDIALAVGEGFVKYLPFTMTMLMQAAQSPMPEDVRRKHNSPRCRCLASTDSCCASVSIRRISR